MTVQEERSDRDKSWIIGVRREIQEYGLDYLYDENNLNKSKIKEIKNKCREICYIRMKAALVEKSSLKLLQLFNISMTGGEYIKILKAKQIATLARYRLGTWLWMCEKDQEGNRICTLCGEIENGIHAFIDCKYNKKGIDWIRNLFVENSKKDLPCFIREVSLFLELVENSYKQRQIRDMPATDVNTRP